MNIRADEESFDTRPVEGPQADDEIAVLAKALAHPTRVHILRTLRRQDGATVTDLVTSFGAAQSTVSEHVKVLCDAGLVLADTNSRKGSYRADVHALRRFKALVGSL